MDADDTKKNEIDNLLDDFGSDDEPDDPPTQEPETKEESSDWNTESADTNPEPAQEDEPNKGESEDELTEKAEPVLEESAPKKAQKRHKRGKDSVLPASPPSSEDEEQATYQVQRGFIVAGRTYHRGDVIPVKCKFCALWEKEWGGRVRCAPGKAFSDGEVMRAEKFSCQSFFIAKEMESELNTFLTMRPLEVAIVRRMLPGMKRLLACEPWLNTQIEKKDLVVDASQVFENAKGFVSSFTTIEQLQHAEQFIRSYAGILLRQQKENTKKKKVKFEPGDWVEWTDTKTGMTQKGIVLRRKTGNVMLAGIDGPNQGVTLTFKEKEWRKKSDPQIVRKAANLSD